MGFIEKYARELGYYVMFYSAKDMDQIFQMVMGWNIDGVIAVSFSKRNCEKIYQLTKKPIVSIDAYGELEDQQDKQVLNIGLDDESGGYKMMKYLLGCGYRHIKVCAARDSGVDHLRFVGAQNAVPGITGREGEITVCSPWNGLDEAEGKLCMADAAQTIGDGAVLSGRYVCAGGD